MIQLDHYIGREVEAINPVEDDEDGAWQIELQGNVRIINYDDNYEIPDESLIGLSLNRVIISNDETRLFFGTEDNPDGTMMFLNPMQYGINDPAREDIEGTVRPQAGGARDLEVPPHPDERVAEGPQEPEEAAREAEEASEQTDDE